MKSIKDKVKKIYGWFAPSLTRDLERIEKEIREDEYQRCARLFLTILLDNLNLPVKELYNRIREEENGYTSNNDAVA